MVFTDLPYYYYCTIHWKHSREQLDLNRTSRAMRDEHLVFAGGQMPLEQDARLLKSLKGLNPPLPAYCCALHLHWSIVEWHVASLCFLAPQLPEAFQGDENQGPAIVVSADPQRPPLPAHQSAAHHSQGPEMRQHLHHGTHGLGEDRGPGLSHAQEGFLRQECHR